MSGGWDWDDLRFVLALSREGSMSGAARVLAVSHTTVSRRIEGFSARMGVQLFERAAAGYEATAAGEEILRVARAIEGQMARLERVAMRQSDPIAGPLRVTTVDGMMGIFAQEFAAFTRAYPEIELEVVSSLRTLSLARREADVALRVTNNPSEQLVGRKLLRFEYAAYAARSLVEEVGEGAPLEDFPWVIWNDKPGVRMLERWLLDHLVAPRIVARLDSAVVFTELLRAGAGAGHAILDWGERQPELVRIGGHVPEFGIDLWLLTHPDHSKTARVQAFIRFMADAIRARHRALYATLELEITPERAPHPPVRS